MNFGNLDNNSCPRPLTHREDRSYLNLSYLDRKFMHDINRPVKTSFRGCGTLSSDA